MARVAHHVLPTTVMALVAVVTAFAIGTAAAASDVASAFAAGAYDGSYFGRIKNNCKRGSKGPSFQARIENGRITGSVRHRTGTISFDEQLTGDGRVSLTGYWRGETTYSFSVKLVEGGLQVAMKLRWSRGSCGGKKILPRPWRKPSIVAAAKPPAPAREVSGRATDPAPPVKTATDETPAPVDPEATGVGEQTAAAPQLAARPETAPP